MKRLSNARATKTPPVTRYSVAKVVLLGEARVGKTALGWCLAGGEFSSHPISHPIQFWVLEELTICQPDGTKCEVVAWDMASQPDYRLIHPLSAADADVVLLVFDPSDRPDPLRQVNYWLSQLGQRQERRCKTILVATRSEVGAPVLTKKELDAFCKANGITGGFIATSAARGDGLAKLRDRIRSQINWAQLPKIPISPAFEALKNYVLDSKKSQPKRSLIPSLARLRHHLEAAHVGRFTDGEVLNSVRVLESYGYLRLLDTSPSEARVLLIPELFDALAASFVAQARNHERGFGALEEDRVLSHQYNFPELRGLTNGQKDLLVQSVRVAFLEGRLAVRCQRELIGTTRLLVFPELVTLRRPMEPDTSDFRDDVAYGVTGDVENLFAVLVVSIGYTNNARKAEHWHNQARYEFGEGDVCGFRHEEENESAASFVLYIGTNTTEAARTLFRGLFERLLQRPKLRVVRYEPAVCGKCGHSHDWRMVRDRRREGKDSAFCSDCGRKLVLPEVRKIIPLAEREEPQVEAQTRVVLERTHFETVLARVEARLKAPRIKRPKCFISYAWGVPDHERWVERMADDLAKAGIQIVYDRKDNQLGSSLTRFISQIPYCDSVVVVGTPLYLQKFENRLSSTGSVVAAEVDLISQRLIGTQKEKRTVKTLLLAGEKKTSLPPLMWDGILADFRNESAYFITALELILSLYKLPPNHPAVADLRESLRGPEMR